MCEVRGLWWGFAQLLRLVVIMNKVAHLEDSLIQFKPEESRLKTYPDKFLAVVGARDENNSGAKQVFHRDFCVVGTVSLETFYNY